MISPARWMRGDASPKKLTLRAYYNDFLKRHNTAHVDGTLSPVPRPRPPKFSMMTTPIEEEKLLCKTTKGTIVLIITDVKIGVACENVEGLV